MRRHTGTLLRFLLAIVSGARWLAPASRRRDWHRQWRADIWHEWRWLNLQPHSIAGRATLIGRTAGAVRHAFWLRGHVRSIEMVSQDLRYGWRSLVCKPGFAAVAVLTLGVGIGANTTIFGVMNAVLLRPLAFSDPDRVVRVSGRTTTGAPINRFSFPDFADYRTRARTLADLNGVNLGTFILGVDNRTDQILGEIVSGRYLSMLGVAVPVGRTLGDADDRIRAAPVAVISDALWRRQFAREPHIVGRTVLLNGTSYAIVGVATAAFGGSFVGAPIDIWIPIGSSGRALGPDWNVDRSRRTLALIGRLAPGVTRDQARSELQIVADDLAREFRSESRPSSVDVQPGTLAAGDQRRLARMFLSLLLGLVALVLLIACANVGNLLLARILGRRRELAIRLALGASRWQIVRLLITESLLVAGAGGAAALLLSLWTTRAFAGIRPLPTLTLRLDVHPDLRVVGFTVLTTLAAAVVLAVVGALQAVRPDLTPALKEEATTAIGGRSPARLRATLAALQIAVSLLLLIGAALFVRSVRQAEAIDLGFEPRGVLALDIDSGGRTAMASRPFFRDVLQRVSALPGVEAAAVSTRAPLDSSTPVVRVNAREAVSANAEPGSTMASLLVVSPAYFDVVKTPLLAGRAFTEQDDASRLAVVIINETLAARLWPGDDAIGRQLWLDPLVTGTPSTVVGIASNSKYLTLGEEQQGHVYLPFAQHSRPGMALLVRSPNPPDRLANQVQAALRAVDPGVQGFFTRTLSEHVSVSMLPVRLAARASTVIAALALGLAVIGLYSLVSFLVAERTHEIGLRVALGASGADVLRLVLGYGLRLVVAGLAIGIPIALASSRLLGRLLYGVSPTDPGIFAIVPAAVLLVAAVACYVPARRAMHMDPLVALRRL